MEPMLRKPMIRLVKTHRLGLPARDLVSQWRTRTLCLDVSHSRCQSVSQSINQPINQSINQSIKQKNKQSSYLVKI